MGNWDILKASIADTIKTNGNQEITGQLLQNILMSMVGSLGKYATFAGPATPATDPGTPDGPVFYVAIQAGTYQNFSGLKVENTELAFLMSGDLSWRKISTTIKGEKGEKGDTGETGPQGPKGDTPVLTAQPDGTIISDGVVLTDVLKVAAENSDTQTARVEKLADNPPKIVEVDGMAYWAFYDLETQQYITSEYPARGEKGEPGGGSGVNVVQTTGQSKTDVMSQKAVTDELEKKVNAEEGKGLSSNDYTKEEKQKVSTNSELFFILPEGTQFPYTLTEEDKTKFSKARFLILKSASTGSIFVLSPEGLSDPLNGTWAGVYNSTGIVTVSVSKGVIGVPSIVSLSDDKAVKFTAQSLSDDQKTQARTNIDAEKATIVENLEGAEVTIDVNGGTMYVCGELTSLNIASVENSTKPSIIRFTSGTTATQFSYPENFNITGWTKPEENKSYTICILFGAGNMTYDE